MTPDSELSFKRALIAALLDERGLDAILLTVPANVSWITCGGDPVVDLTAPIGVAAVLCTRGGETLLTNTIERARLVEEALPAPPAQVDAPGWDEADPLTQARRIVPGARLGADLPADGTVDCAIALRALRMVLGPAEGDRYRALGRATGAAIEAAARAVVPGMSELDIAGLLAAETYRRGAVPIVVLVAVDRRIGAYRHPLPTPLPLERHALLVVCARRHGLVASATRAVHIGALPSDLARRHMACARVDAAMLGATQAGATAGEVFAATQQAYAREGYPGEWALHHQGGAAGYASREWIATPGGTERIEEGMAFAWNPSITGTKTEDTVLLGPAGLEILTATDDWPTIDAEAGGVTYARPAILVRHAYLLRP